MSKLSRYNSMGFQELINLQFTLTNPKVHVTSLY
jgi:hypothetical protein